MILLLSITNVPHVYSLSPSPGQIVQSIVFHVWPTTFKILFLSNPMKTCYKASKILSSQPCQQLISFLPQSHIGPGSNQWEPGSNQWEPGSSQWEPGSSQWEPGFNQWEPGSNLWESGSNQWEPGSSQWEPGSNQWEHIFSELDKGGGGRLNNL